MKVLGTHQFISERMKINPITRDELDKAKEKLKPKYKYFPNSKPELRRLINERISREGRACDLNDINVSKITDMSYLFAAKDENEQYIHDRVADFMGDISKWDVSNVISMEGMFYFAEYFNSNISNWIVSSVGTMEGMFCKAIRFNQNISGWTVSSLTNMSYMFQNASSFNQDLSGWDVQNVTKFTCCFFGSRMEHLRGKWPKF